MSAPEHAYYTNITVGSTWGLRSITLQNSQIRAVILPELGGKMCSLLRRHTGREFLLQPSNSALPRRIYGVAFDDGQATGFDECFPTVSECEYPDGNFRGIRLPDHGEVWSQAWQYEIRRDEVWLAVAGHRLPYILRKRIRLEDDGIILNYELENLTDQPFHYIWSAHPLLNAEPRCRILLPQEVTDLFVEWSHAGRLGRFGSSSPWPRARLSDGREQDLSVLGPPQHSADKLFTSRLSHGSCALYYPDSDEFIAFRFDASVVPYVGIWICHGGWPNGNSEYYTAALEPCTGRPDSLAEAIRRGECQKIAPRAKQHWELQIQVRSGLPAILPRPPNVSLAPGRAPGKRASALWMYRRWHSCSI